MSWLFVLAATDSFPLSLYSFRRPRGGNHSVLLWKMAAFHSISSSFKAGSKFVSHHYLFYQKNHKNHIVRDLSKDKIVWENHIWLMTLNQKGRDTYTQS